MLAILKRKSRVFIGLSFTVVTLLIIVFFALISQFSVQAQSASELRGWAWSSNIGWISMSCANTGVCDQSNYGVRQLSGGVLDGWAWSDNIGWIKFNGLQNDDFPNGNGTQQVNSQINGTSVDGWIRAQRARPDALNVPGGQGGQTLGGWDGWISLSGSNYGVTYDTGTGDFGGYAWGSDVVGWVDFSGVYTFSGDESDTYDFSVSVNSVGVAVGDTVSSHPVSLKKLNLDVADQEVVLELATSTLPSGLVVEYVTNNKCTPSNACSILLDIDASQATEEDRGIYEIAVLASPEKGVARSTSFTIDLGNPFDYSLDALNIEVEKGKTTRRSVAVKYLDGVSEKVTLENISSPSGVSTSIDSSADSCSPPSVSEGTCLVYFFVTGNSEVTTDVTVTTESENGLEKSYTFKVKVTEPTPPGINPDPTDPNNPSLSCEVRQTGNSEAENGYIQVNKLATWVATINASAVDVSNFTYEYVWEGSAPLDRQEGTLDGKRSEIPVDVVYRTLGTKEASLTVTARSLATGDEQVVGTCSGGTETIEVVVNPNFQEF